MLLRHSAIYLLARGVPGLIGFATIIIYTRLLSPEAYGEYSLVVAGALLTNAVLYHWLNASLLRFLPQYLENEADFLATIRNGFILISLLAGGCGALLAFLWDDPEWNKLIFIGILLVWAQAWFTINLELARSRLSPTRYGVISLIKAVSALVLGVVFVFWGFAAYGALTGMIFGLLVSALWASWGEWGSIKRFRFDRGQARAMLVYGLPLTASFALAVVISSSDRLMLAWLIDESATGLYAAGQVLAQQSIGVLMTTVHLAAYPLIVRTLERDDSLAARIQLRNNAILLLGVGLPVATVFIILAPDVAKIFLGKEFQTAGIELMPWFAIAALLASVRAYYFDLAFYLGKRTHIQIVVMSSAALLNVILNFLLIPIFGLLGAAYASVAAHGSAVILSAILGSRAFRLPVILGDAIRLLFAALTMAAVLYLLPNGDGILSLFSSIVLGGSIYLCCVVMFDLGGVRGMSMRFITNGLSIWKGIISR